MTIEEAAAKGAKTVILGVANRGGFIPDSWIVELVKALDLGMDIASGLHTKITAIPALKDKAAAKGRNPFDVRHHSRDPPVAHCRPPTRKPLRTGRTGVQGGQQAT